jgi:hypothetical protein
MPPIPTIENRGDLKILPTRTLTPTVDCIGPDGKHFNTTQQACDDFNDAWSPFHFARTTPNPVTQTNVNINSNSNTINNNPNNPLANQPRDSQGVLCTDYESRCKYECSISDTNVNSFLSTLSNDVREYQLSVSVYGENSADTKIWANAVMDVYNTVYNDCINSPVFHPQKPI